MDRARRRPHACIWAGACVRSARPGRSDEWRSARPAGAAPTIQSGSDVRTHERLLAGEPRDASKRSAARIDRPEPRREQSLVAQADSSAQLGKQARRSRGPRRARSFQGCSDAGATVDASYRGASGSRRCLLGVGFRSSQQAACAAWAVWLPRTNSASSAARIWWPPLSASSRRRHCLRVAVVAAPIRERNNGGTDAGLLLLLKLDSIPSLVDACSCARAVVSVFAGGPTIGALGKQSGRVECVARLRQEQPASRARPGDRATPHWVTATRWPVRSKIGRAITGAASAAQVLAPVRDAGKREASRTGGSRRQNPTPRPRRARRARAEEQSATCQES